MIWQVTQPCNGGGLSLYSRPTASTANRFAPNIPLKRLSFAPGRLVFPCCLSQTLRMITYSKILLLSSALSFASPLWAAELEVVVDPTTAKIDFTLGATMHTVEGSLKLKSGEVRFDPATGVVVGKLVIDATSATTSNEGRDKKMHAEVLESGLSNPHPPLLYVLLHFWTMPGSSEIWLRLLPILFAVAGLVVATNAPSRSQQNL